MTKQPKKDAIPTDVSREELAHFWDTHSVIDYLDELKPAKVRFAKKLEHVLAVRFDSETLTQLETQASRKGIGPTTLVRMWVKERLFA